MMTIVVVAVAAAGGGTSVVCLEILELSTSGKCEVVF